MKGSLRRKMLVSFMLVVVLILLGLSFGISALIRQYFLEEKQQELIGKGQEMATVLDDYLSGRMTEPQLVEFVNRIDGFLDARIWAVDPAGRVLAMSSPRRGAGIRQGPGQGMGPAGGGQGMRSPAVIRSFLQGLSPVFHGEVLTRTFDHPYYGEDMMVVAVPLKKSDGSVAGAIILNAPVQGLNAFLKKVYVAVGLLGLLALALTAFVVGRIARGIVKPLREMEETAAAMAQGSYDRRVGQSTDDEVGQLGASLNKLAQELANFVAKTEHMEKLRRDFVANVSHELRTPLTIIRGYTEALRDGTVTDPSQAAGFSKLVVSETERLERLIRDLLDLSRLQSQPFYMEMETLPLDELACGVVEMFRPKAAEKNVRLEWSAVRPIPAVRGNGDRLTQLLMILLDNALKYTPECGTVAVNLGGAEGGAVLTVSDTGSGIPAADLPYIWERFFKVDKAHSRDSEGTGLGLAIAREIIDRHDIRVDVQSELGRGTTFSLHFPAAD